jgi:hypothetical protein
MHRKKALASKNESDVDGQRGHVIERAFTTLTHEVFLLIQQRKVYRDWISELIAQIANFIPRPEPR